MPHLYLHVPFCARRCSYCDFSIAVRKRVPAAEYVDAVLRELDWLRAADPGPTARGLIGNDAGPLLFEHRGTLKDSLSVAAPGSADRGLDTLYLGGGAPRRRGRHAARGRDRQRVARSDLRASGRAGPRLGARPGSGPRARALTPLSVRPDGGAADAARPLDLARRGHGPGRRALRRGIPAGARTACGLRLSFLRGLQRRPQRVALPPQRGLLVRAAVPRLRPGGALVRRPRAPLEPRGVGGVPARPRGRPLARRITGSPPRRGTGTRAGFAVVAHR